ncbi:MAG: hypothetical protein H7306_03315 [Bacteriovorax sp.]|nr:hypothetical protein [Rhizobacter sp.]
MQVMQAAHSSKALHRRSGPPIMMLVECGDQRIGVMAVVLIKPLVTDDCLGGRVVAAPARKGA